MLSKQPCRRFLSHKSSYLDRVNDFFIVVYCILDRKFAYSFSFQTALHRINTRNADDISGVNNSQIFQMFTINMGRIVLFHNTLGYPTINRLYHISLKVVQYHKIQDFVTEMYNLSQSAHSFVQFLKVCANFEFIHSISFIQEASSFMSFIRCARHNCNMSLQQPCFKNITTVFK